MVETTTIPTAYSGEITLHKYNTDGTRLSPADSGFQFSFDEIKREDSAGHADELVWFRKGGSIVAQFYFDSPMATRLEVEYNRSL